MEDVNIIAKVASGAVAIGGGGVGGGGGASCRVGRLSAWDAARQSVSVIGWYCGVPVPPLLPQKLSLAQLLPQEYPLQVTNYITIY